MHVFPWGRAAACGVVLNKLMRHACRTTEINLDGPMHLDLGTLFLPSFPSTRYSTLIDPQHPPATFRHFLPLPCGLLQRLLIL